MRMTRSLPSHLMAPGAYSLTWWIYELFFLFLFLFLTTASLIEFRAGFATVNSLLVHYSCSCHFNVILKNLEPSILVRSWDRARRRSITITTLTSGGLCTSLHILSLSGIGGLFWPNQAVPWYSHSCWWEENKGGGRDTASPQDRSLSRSPQGRRAKMDLFRLPHCGRGHIRWKKIPLAEIGKRRRGR